MIAETYPVGSYERFKQLCKEVRKQIKKPAFKGGCMPFLTGNLRSHTTGRASANKSFAISISGVEYAEYLEGGTRPHNIPNAFGRGFNYGLAGRFNGKFHPGSAKWKGFISDPKRANSFLNTIITAFTQDDKNAFMRSKASGFGFVKTVDRDL